MSQEEEYVNRRFFEMSSYEYDDACIQAFLEQQLKLFPEEVANTPEEAEAFLEDCMAMVCDDKAEVIE